MGLFTRTKAADTTRAETRSREVGKKIILNFGSGAAKAVQEMAAATLEAGGFEEAAAAPERAEMGDKMPDGSIYAGASPDTGTAMYVMPVDAPVTMTFKEAREYASKLDVHGHQDWRVRTKGELKVLFNNRAAIGGFDVGGPHPGGWYWSSSSHYRTWLAWGQRFSDGRQDNYDKGFCSSLRCVR